jgi:hypothetical protein
MLDDDIKLVESLQSDLEKSLKNKDGTLKVSKHPNSEKELCNEQKQIIENHLKVCSICAKSMQTYKENMNIPMTPPCPQFLKQLQEHINHCLICNDVNKKWNEDSIPITPAMRKSVSILSKLKKLTGVE